MHSGIVKFLLFSYVATLISSCTEGMLVKLTGQFIAAGFFLLLIVVYYLVKELFLSKPINKVISKNGYRFSDFNRNQKEELIKGYKSKVDLAVYAKKEYNNLQMSEIRQGLEHNIDVSAYANEKFDNSQMWEIREGLAKGIDVSKYAYPGIRWEKMGEIRNNLLRTRNGEVNLGNLSDPSTGDSKQEKQNHEQLLVENDVVREKEVKIEHIEARQEYEIELPVTEAGDIDYDVLLETDLKEFCKAMLQEFGLEETLSTISITIKTTNNEIVQLQKNANKESSTNKIDDIKRRIKKLQERSENLSIELLALKAKSTETTVLSNKKRAIALLSKINSLREVFKANPQSVGVQEERNVESGADQTKEVKSNEYAKLLKIILIFFIITSAISAVTQFLSYAIWDEYILGIVSFLGSAIALFGIYLILKKKAIGYPIFVTLMILQVPFNLYINKNILSINSTSSINEYEYYIDSIYTSYYLNLLNIEKFSNNDAIKTLYPVYRKNTAQPVTEQEFRAMLSDPQKRKILYQGLNKLGYGEDRLGTYEQFDMWINDAYQNPANVLIQESEHIDAIKILYRAANKLFKDVGDIDKFRRSLSDSTKRKKLYGALAAKGVQAGEYEQFERWIYASLQNPTNVITSIRKFDESVYSEYDKDNEQGLQGSLILRKNMNEVILSVIFRVILLSLVLFIKKKDGYSGWKILLKKPAT